LANALKGSRKRLSQIVTESGIDAFTREDFFHITGRVSQDPSRLVLVGGQALETWGILLNVLAPTGNQHPLTEDTDWLGSVKDAEWLASLLGNEQSVELNCPSMDDSTPNTAVMFLQRPDGRVLLMDFLRCVTGLNEKDIKTLAVTLDVPHADGSKVRLQVLHPLHCLASRMANLQTHPAKRQGNGPMQAVWAVDIVRAFLYALAHRGDAAQTRKACHSVAELAAYGPAEYCYLNFNLDPLSAVTSDVITACGEGFADNDWPRTVARINGKRQKWQDRHEQRRLAQERRVNR
jgi:hypothetical protein